MPHSSSLEQGWVYIEDGEDNRFPWYEDPARSDAKMDYTEPQGKGSTTDP